ncbi:ROK family protein [Clostridium mediterraneense]|uniref:ROK family protein n=1 Tax=Clostridium mediterraneense TaxID=1805472 RepID=UPI000831A65E|nr:ROK family protein [Clostridium mediterraneense]
MIACLDIGGTSIKVAVSDREGNLKEKGFVKVEETFEALMGNIVEWINSMKEKYEIEGVAISSPGAVDTKTGIVGGASAVPCIHGPNWKEEILKRTSLKASIENDANCAALAEVFSGTAKGVSDMMFLVCGTGIGGAIVNNGKIHHGKHLHGGEFGYMLMEEEDGQFYNFSEVASTMSFVRRVRKYYNDESWDGVKIFEEAANGNEVCIEAIERFYKNLAIGIFNIQYVYDPEMILLGGAISEREDFIDRINEKIDEIMSKVEIAKVRPQVLTCTHKKDANLIGAVANFIKEGN